MLNILYVFGGEKASGAEKVIERLIEHNLGQVTPHLLVAPGSYAMGLQAKGPGYPVTVVNALKKLNRSSTGKLAFFWKAMVNDLKTSALVIKYVKRNNIDLVHANTIVPAFYLLPAVLYFKAFNQKVKFVWSDHDLKYFSGFENKLAALAYKMYHRTLAVSDAVKKKYPTGNKAVTLYNGINLNEFSPNESKRSDFRDQHGFSQPDILIGIVATIEPRKGQLALLKAFKPLSEANDRLHLLLAGPLTEDDAEYTRQVLDAVESNPQATYLGKVSDMPAFYNGCDIIVNNSNQSGSEPLGTTIYEAMAIKKVVAASNTGGTPEIVADNVDGFLFECDNETALRNKLAEITGSLGSLDDVREKAREKVKTKFNIDVMARNYNAIIGMLVNQA